MKKFIPYALAMIGAVLIIKGAELIMESFA